MQRSQYKRETSSSWETKQLTNVWMISWIEISLIPAFAKVKMGVYYQVAPRRSLFIRTAPVFREKEKAWKVGEHNSCYQKRATPARSWTKSSKVVQYCRTWIPKLNRTLKPLLSRASHYITADQVNNQVYQDQENNQPYQRRSCTKQD